MKACRRGAVGVAWEVGMRVYLVRHGDAKPKDVDPNRGLSAKGLRDVQQVAAFLKPLGIRVSTIWHSGKTRASQTAQTMATVVTSQEGVVEHEGLAPNDPIGPVKKALRKADADVMIVGHLPSLSRLASALVVGDEAAEVITFPAGGVLCVERDDEGDWAIAWMMVPALVP